MDTYDVIVVGAGAVGSAAAYHAAKAGQRVLLLERFEIDHQMGSSYGASRIIRYAYNFPIYVELAKTAYAAWRALEAESGETLMTITGGLDFGAHDEPSMMETVDSLRAGNIPFEVLTRAEQERRFPQFRLNDDMLIVYQADAGVLRASKCVRTHVRLAQERGAVVVDNTPVTGISVHADSVDVQTPKGAFSGGKLILVPGGWGKQVFGMVGLDLPLTPVHAQEQYFDAQPAAEYTTEQFPIFIAHQANDYGTMPYGLPSVDGSGLKVGMHGGPIIPDLDSFDRNPRQNAVEQARDFMRRHIPGGDNSLLYARTCLYTMTPDEHFVTDTHPAHPHVVISASCSGHAFKFSTLIGDILVQLALNGTTPYDVSMFSMARFGAHVQSSP